MPLNPYDSCPCGSGKKFKWCCQPYFDQIEKALDLQQQNQHAAAVRTMEAVAQAHPKIPQVWGFFAQLLAAEGHIDQAEEALEKAFALEPNFPMGHLLRGAFRQAEGEVIGALLLFRKAAEAYDPEAKEQLAHVYEMIARHELMLNRIVACRAALARALAFTPADQELREQFDAMFGPESRLPECARKAYTFRPTAKPIAADFATGKLSDAKKAFDELVKQVPDDPAGWFNLGLVKAWLGEQPAAVDALNKSIELEWDDAKAEEAAALAEVLRCAKGMEEDADYLEYRAMMPLRDPQSLVGLLQEWAQNRRIIAPQSDPESGAFTCLVVEELPNLLDTGTSLARIVANVMIAGGAVRVWSTDPDNTNKVVNDIRDRVQLAVGEPAAGSGCVQFGDIAQDALAYPTQTADLSVAEQRLKAHAEHYFETTWSNEPFKSLGGATPIDAAGSKLLRKKLLGAIRFVEDCLRGSAPRKQVGNDVVPMDVYNFDRLRHKLGVEKQAPGEAPKIAVPADPAAPPKRDIPAMSAADLAGLPVAELSATELEDAMRTALKLDARDLAVAFAQAGALKPADPAKPDRYPFFACLITAAIAEGNAAEALKHAKDGATYDAAHNGGKRANEFAIRKAQLFAKTGDPESAVKEFDDLIARHPDEGKFYVTATESMLSARQGAKALAFAERGLALARSSGNRDLEGACLELSAAAKRLG